MRELHSRPGSRLAWPLLAAIGSVLLLRATTAQEVRRLERPAQIRTRTVVRPVHFPWSELLRLQDSLRRRRPTVEPNLDPKIPDGEKPGLELPRPGLRHASGRVPSPSSASGARGSAAGGGIESLAPCTGFAAAPAVHLSTASQGDGMDGGSVLYHPANGAGSVGPSHLMTMAANKTLIEDRLGASVSSMDTLTFWSPLSPSSVTYCRLDFELVSGRWIATARGGSGVGATSILFAISDTSDPTLGWNYYSVSADPGSTTFADGLKMGYNSTWVAVTADMYTSSGAGGNAGSRLYTFDMAAALAGGPVTVTTFSSSYVFSTTGLGTATTNFRVIPVRALDTSIADLWLLDSRFTSGTSIVWQMFRITGTGASPSVVPTPGSLLGASASAMFIPLDYSNDRLPVSQLGETRSIDSLQPDGQLDSTHARLADAVVRNGHLYVVHTAGLPGPANATATQNGVCFYEIDPALPLDPPPFVQDVQITDGAGTTLMYPSLGVNCGNDVLIGFTRADATRYLEAGYCTRLGTDAPDTMGPTTLLKQGESPWWQSTSTLAPWGFYSNTAVDPLDDRTLWTLQPYAAKRVGSADADSRWGLWWGSVGNWSEWTGASNRAWTNASNWNNGVPDSTKGAIVHDVVNDPLVSDNLQSCAALLLDAGALLELNGSFALHGSATIDGTISGTGELRVEGPGTLSGSGTIAVTTVFERDVAVQASTISFSDVEIAASTEVTVAEDMSLLGDLTLEGSLVVDSDLGIDGDFTGGILASLAAGTMTFGGDIEHAGTLSTQNKIVINEPSTTTLVVNVTEPIPAGLEMDIGGTLVMLADLEVQGDLTLIDGTLTTSADATLDVDTLAIEADAGLETGGFALALPGDPLVTVDGELSVENGTLELSASTVTIQSGGTLRVVDGAVVGLDDGGFALAAGGYALTVEDGATLAARGFVFQDMGLGGVVVKKNAIIAPAPFDLRAGLFTMPAPGGTLLQIERASDVRLYQLRFEDPLHVGSKNVRTLLGSAKIKFRFWHGHFGGSAFEDDPGVPGILDWTEKTRQNP